MHQKRTRRSARAKQKTLLDRGRCLGRSAVRVEVEKRGDLVSQGGLGVASVLIGRLGLAESLDAHVQVLSAHKPYHESDHILSHALSLYGGGSCIEDLRGLQRSEAMVRLLGASRIPAPSTAGDFLRRFGRRDLRDLQRAMDEARVRVWRKLPPKRRRRATIDLDSTIVPVSGECKQGAAFSYDGRWSYHPSLVTLAQTHEVLRVENRPGNAASARGVARLLDQSLGLTAAHFDRVAVRGDSAFGSREIIRTCEKHGAQFALAWRSSPALLEKVAALKEVDWRGLTRPSARRVACGKPRRKRHRYRRAAARKRKYKTLATTAEYVAELPYVPTGSKKTYRMIVVCKEIETTTGQRLLLHEDKYQFILTDIEGLAPHEIVDFAYKRCDQENIIGQLKAGVAAMKMPTGSLLANAAFLLCGALAWNLKSWICLLGLGDFALRAKWKRFRHDFVYVAARVVTLGRDTVLRLASGHRYAPELVHLAEKLRQMRFA